MEISKVNPKRTTKEIEHDRKLGRLLFVLDLLPAQDTHLFILRLS